MEVGIMNNLILECNDFLKNGRFIYAFCGGYALELYLNKSVRVHSDIDIFIFEEDIKNFVDFILSKGWNIYARTGHMQLSQISNSNSERLADCSTLWAIKPFCSFVKLDMVNGEENTFIYEIITDNQLCFDFIDIFISKRQDEEFICDYDKNITRKLDISIMYNNTIPYLSPEIKLFFDSNPRYIELEYFKNKNRTDFESVAPLLPEENRNWLINALEIKYPDGHKRIEQLKSMNFAL